MEFVLGQKIKLEEKESETVIFAPLPVTSEDVDFEAWKASFLKDYPKATLETAMHTAWWSGYRARLIIEGQERDK